MAKKESSTGLQKLLEDQLHDVYYVEKQLVKALAKMAKTATNEDLKQGFTMHLEETKGQVERLEEVFASLDLPVKAKKCPAIDGILEEAKEIMEEFADDTALDAGLVCAAQKVEHYEIATYGSLKAWAEQLGHEDAAQLFGETLEEEKAADQKLSEVAETVVNIEATEEEDEEEENTAMTKKKPAKKAAKKAASRK